jgi:CRP-like cAMP-binding protein
LEKGTAKVIVYEKGTDPNDPNLDKKILLVKYLPKGSGFGELALLYNDKRSATIEAFDNCSVFTLDGNIFKSIIIGSSIKKRSMIAGFLD